MKETQRIVLKKNGQKCEIEYKLTDKGMSATTKGKACKKIMGKDYFASGSVEFPRGILK